MSIFRYAKVQAEAHDHIVGLDIAKNLAEAALQSSRQCRQTRTALKKARAEEQAMKDREIARQKKEAEARLKREAEKEKKDREKEEKRRQKEEDKKRKREEEKATEAENVNADKRRRGRGTEEIGEADWPILSSRFSKHEIHVFDELKRFAESFIDGFPSIWRARRSHVKKVLEAHDTYDAKSTTSASMLLKAEFKQYLSKFAEKCSSDKDVIKSPAQVSEQCQEHAPPLRLDQAVLEYLEHLAQQSRPAQCVVLDESLVEPLLDDSLANIQFVDAMAKSKAECEVAFYRNLHLVGFQHGKCFSGLMQGLWPHLMYQMEGTRAMCFASFEDVLRLWFKLSLVIVARFAVCQLFICLFVIGSWFSIPHHDFDLLRF